MADLQPIKLSSANPPIPQLLARRQTSRIRSGVCWLPAEYIVSPLSLIRRCTDAPFARVIVRASDNKEAKIRQGQLPSEALPSFFARLAWKLAKGFCVRVEGPLTGHW